MNNLISPFLDRFKHPIFSSIFGSSFLINIDSLIPVIHAFFKSSDAIFNLTILDAFITYKNSSYNYRIIIPIIIGVFYAFLILPASDSAYGKVIAFWMRKKQNWIDSEQKLLYSRAAIEREGELDFIFNCIESGSFLKIFHNISPQTKISVFRVEDSNLKNRCVYFDERDLNTA